MRQAIIAIIQSAADQPADLGLRILTDFGDSAVLLPLSIVFFVWLLATRTFRIAMAWLATLLVCNAVIALLKIYFIACPFGDSVNSPSGHTGFSILVYGSLTAALALAARSHARRAMIVISGMALAGAIAASRFLLHSHGLAEVFIGAAVGAGSLAFFVRLYRRDPGKGGRLLPLGLAIMVVLVVFHGLQFRAENYLRDFSSSFAVYTQACGAR